VEDGFPRLPSGCAIQLEEAAQRTVVEHLRRMLSSWKALGEDLVEDWPLATFLRRADLEPEELYLARKSFAQLRAQRGFLDHAPDHAITRALPRLLHVDDTERLTRWRRWLSQDQPPAADLSDPYQRMLFAALGQARRPLNELDAFLAELWSDPVILDEVRQLLGVLDDRRRHITHGLDGLPFRVHGTYSRDEVSAGLGEARRGKLLRTQSGVFKCDTHHCDVLFVTLEKDEKDFTPTTLYNDYPLSQRRFHWESQGTTRLESKTGRRYQQPPPGWRILLFVRQAKRDARKITMPYLFLGPVRCVSATGGRPIQIVWELDTPMPPGWFNTVKIAAG
jgi:hypothetical protein